jgi:hypothetical protein
MSPPSYLERFDGQQTLDISSPTVSNIASRNIADARPSGWADCLSIRSVCIEGDGKVDEELGCLFLVAILVVGGVILYQYRQLPVPVKQAIKEHNAGNRWKLMVTPPNGDAVELGRYTDQGSCEKVRQAHVRKAFHAGVSVPGLTCEHAHFWWVRALAYLQPSTGQRVPPDQRKTPEQEADEFLRGNQPSKPARQCSSSLLSVGEECEMTLQGGTKATIRRIE